MHTTALHLAHPLLPSVALAIVLTLLSGAGDALGFVHAARIWQGDVVHWPSVARSGGAFAFGMVMQWISLRFQHRMGITVAELQAAVWFAATMIGIAVLSRAVQQWPIADRLVAVGVLCGLTWLVVRTGG